MQISKNKNTHKGFTLIELIIAICIMLITAVIATPFIIHNIERSRVTNIVENILNIRTAFNSYFIKTSGVIADVNSNGDFLDDIIANGWISPNVKDFFKKIGLKANISCVEVATDGNSMSLSRCIPSVHSYYFNIMPVAGYSSGGSSGGSESGDGNPATPIRTSKIFYLYLESNYDNCSYGDYNCVNKGYNYINKIYNKLEKILDKQVDPNTGHLIYEVTVYNDKYYIAQIAYTLYSTNNKILSEILPDEKSMLFYYLRPLGSGR